jgi:hypothetical protein
MQLPDGSVVHPANWSLDENGNAVGLVGPRGEVLGGAFNALAYIPIELHAAILARTSTADLTPYLQNWLNACKNRRGYMPAGMYSIYAALVFDSGAAYHIEGDGFDPNQTVATVIKNRGVTDAIVCENVDAGAPNDRALILRDFCVAGGQTSGRGCSFRNIHGLRMTDVWVTSHGSHGIELYECWSCELRGVVSTQNGRHGILLNRKANLVLLDHCIVNGNSRSTGFYNIACTGALNAENIAVTLKACDFTGAGSNPYTTVAEAYGLVMQHCWGVSVEGCYAEATVTALVYADSTARGIRFVANYLQDGAVTFASCPSAVIESNILNAQTSATVMTLTGIAAGGGRVGSNVLLNGASVSGS